jgi:hypothetical protein
LNRSNELFFCHHFRKGFLGSFSVCNFLLRLSEDQGEDDGSDEGYENSHVSLGNCEVADGKEVFAAVGHLSSNPAYSYDCGKDHGYDSALLAGFLPVDTKKDDDGYRKEYWGNKIDDCIIWIVLDDAIKRYNDSIVRNILKSGEEYVASKERGVSVWIARDKNGELYLYKSEPWRCKEDKNGHFDCDADEMLLPMDSDMYPEITWENSPKEFELKAVEK